jgi:tryptophanyl-tRNA synthetase
LAAGAATDSAAGRAAVRHDPEAKPGVSNLLDIGAACLGVGPDELAVQAPTYGALKKLVTDAVVEVLAPVQRRYADLVQDPDHVARVFDEGAERCVEETAPVLESARAAMGLV